MNNGPIQQLVDAAKAFTSIDSIDVPEVDYLTDGDGNVDRLRTAILAVESAQVETRFQIEVEQVDGRWLPIARNSDEEFLEDARHTLNWLQPTYGKRIVRLDTYRSVESDQK